MSLPKRRSLVLIVSRAVLGTGAFWATSSFAARPQIATLPTTAGLTAVCPETGTGEEHWDQHITTINGLGTFQEVVGEASTPTMAQVGRQFISKQGLKTVPLQIVSIGGRGFVEGVGETRFWLDPTRPVKSAIWEKRAGTEFPAVQEMRFHFFYTVEARPGTIYRSINPAVMRSDNVRAFPPLPGTVYHLVKPVELEDISAPGVVVGKVLSN